MTIEEYIAKENNHQNSADVKLLKIEAKEGRHQGGCETCGYGEYDFTSTLTYEYQGAEWKLHLTSESDVVRFLTSLYPQEV